MVEIPKEALGKVAGAVAEKVAEKVTEPAPAPAAVPPSPKAAEAQARAEIEVEEKKIGIREHLPKVPEVVLIILIIALLFLAPGTESRIGRNILLISVCALIIFKDYLFQWLRQRIHLPEHMVDPLLLFNIAFCFLIIWSGLPFTASLILILLFLILSSFGPALKHWFSKWREKRKIKKGEEIEEKELSLDERAAKVMRGSFFMDILDFAIGWIPVVGDVLGFLLNFRLPISCLVHRLIGPGTFMKMLMVNLIDAGIGLVPGAGDIADLFPSNVVNHSLLKREIERKKKGLEAKASPKIMALLLIIIIVGGLAGFVFGAAPYLSKFGGPLGDAMGAIAAIPTSMGTWFEEHNPVQAIKGYYKKQIYLATGDYYTGKVDENAQAKLGVYLEDIKQADPVFYTDRPVIMYATLKVQTLDKPITVSLYCKSTGVEEGVTPQLFPKDEFVVDRYEERDIDCMFPAAGIRRGSWSFELGADFNFKTMSYVKSYFMDGERLRSMRREEIDPLDQYGITDKSPVAIYTAGPVGIGMSVGKPPVGIDLDQSETSMTLGITIENKWDGTIKGINRFVVILPKGFILRLGAEGTLAKCDSLTEEEKGLCSDELNNVYIINEDPELEIKKGDFKSYRIYMKINKADYKKVLGLTPVSTKYFKVIVEYTYGLKKTKTITVKSRERPGLPGVVGAGVDITPPKIEVKPVEKIDNNSAKISWTTDEESNDLFEWWPILRAPPVYPALTTANEAGYTKSHSRTLTGLSPGKEYGYKITSTDKEGNTADATKRFIMPS